MSKLLMIITVCLLIACEGPVGPTGDSGSLGPAGPQGEPGQSNMVSWVYTVVESDVWDYSGQTIVVVRDERFGPGSSYDVWMTVDNDGWCQLDMFNDGEQLQYVVMIYEGYMAIITTANLVGNKLVFYKSLGGDN